MDQYWIWLSAVEGVGPRRFYQILSLFTDPRDVWENVRDNRLEFLGPKVLASLRKARDERFFFELFARLEQAGVRALTRTSDDYPLRLTRTVDAPPTLYVKGEADLNAEKAFAIVGSRRCTREGRRAAQEFAQVLTREGVTVVSGMAMGAEGNSGALRLVPPAGGTARAPSAGGAVRGGKTGGGTPAPTVSHPVGACEYYGNVHPQPKFALDNVGASGNNRETARRRIPGLFLKNAARRGFTAHNQQKTSGGQECKPNWSS